MPGNQRSAPVLNERVQLLTGTLVQLVICEDAKFLNQFSQNGFSVIHTLCFLDNSNIINPLILLTLLKTEGGILALERNLLRGRTVS